MEKGIENKGWAQKLVKGVGSNGGEWGGSRVQKELEERCKLNCNIAKLFLSGAVCNYACAAAIQQQIKLRNKPD